MSASERVREVLETEVDVDDVAECPRGVCPSRVIETMNSSRRQRWHQHPLLDGRNLKASVRRIQTIRRRLSLDGLSLCRLCVPLQSIVSHNSTTSATRMQRGHWPVHAPKYQSRPGIRRVARIDISKGLQVSTMPCATSPRPSKFVPLPWSLSLSLRIGTHFHSGFLHHTK